MEKRRVNWPQVGYVGGLLVVAALSFAAGATVDGDHDIVPLSSSHEPHFLHRSCYDALNTHVVEFLTKVDNFALSNVDEVETHQEQIATATTYRVAFIQPSADPPGEAVAFDIQCVSTPDGNSYIRYMIPTGA